MRLPTPSTLAVLVYSVCSAACMSAEPSRPSAPLGPSLRPTAEVYLRLAGETERSLQRDVLDKWFPAAVDRQNGGFLEDFREDWSPGENRQKNVVYQSRLTWLAARAAARDPRRAAEYLGISRHGVAFLADRQWDRQHGGPYWAVDLAGKPTTARGDEKHVYGIAFVIYAAATNYEVTRDEAALELAKRTFRWLDEHAHDAQHGGYFEALRADGRPIQAGGAGKVDAIGTQYGRKSMNTHIHVLEALTELYSVWRDEAVRLRTEEVLGVCLNKIYTEPGYLTLFFRPDWRRVEGPDSFGHDIETAFLVVEAAEALGRPEDEQTWSVARRLVDHALRVGYDRKHGGFYNEGTPGGGELATEKIWWVQAEGLNVLLLMHEHFGRQTLRYWDAFVRQWDFISKHQIDQTHGGWYSQVHEDGTAIPGRAKSDRWTEGYHQGRALINVTARLRRLAAASR